MKLKDKYCLLREHVVLTQEILNLQPKETIVGAVYQEFNSVELLQLLPKEEVLELLNYYTYVNSDLVHVFPFFGAVIDTLTHKIKLHPFYQEIE
jgi:hypothetical protein